MKKGVVLFAHNTVDVDYYRMAVHTARRVNKFLNLPVCVITDEASVRDYNYTFDHTVYLEPDTSNSRKNKIWNNKGRYQVYELSPYHDTLIVDVDYQINSDQLLSAFDYTSDIVCHNRSKIIMQPDISGEMLNVNSVPALWATVIRFTKTQRVSNVFSMIKMVQENYDHYSRIYGFDNRTYRNDYALTIALKTINHHITIESDYFNWKLLHVTSKVKVYQDTETAYTLYIQPTTQHRGQYMKIKDLDFHMLDKQNFLELTI